jgi:hypothetical protein
MSQPIAIGDFSPHTSSVRRALSAKDIRFQQSGQQSTPHHHETGEGERSKYFNSSEVFHFSVLELVSKSSTWRSPPRH